MVGAGGEVCPLLPKSCDSFGAVKMLRLPLVKVTKQQEESCDLIPNTGQSLISAPFRPSVFALTACRLPAGGGSLCLCAVFPAQSN